MRGSLLVLLAMGCGSKDRDPVEETDVVVPPDTSDTASTDTDTVPPVPCGTLLSTSTFGGAQGESDPIIAITADGATYVVAYFQGSITFDAGGPGETTLTATGTLDTALIRYTPTGALDWVRQVGGTRTSSPRGLAAHADGVVLAGSFEQATTVSVGQGDALILDSIGANDGFVAAFDASGGLSWAKGFGGILNDFTEGIAALADGSVVVVTTHSSAATLGIGEPNETVVPLPAGALNTVSFASLEGSSGDLQWLEKIVGDLTSKVNDVASAGDEVVVVGHVEGPGTAVFGASQPGALNIAPIGDLGFVTRYAADGTLLWVSQIGGHAADAAAVASDGSVLVTGTFSGSATFAPGEVSEVVITTAANDLFLARYAATGAFLWAVGTATVPGGITSAHDIAASDDFGAVVVGSITAPVRFDAGGLNETSITPEGLWDGYFARFDSNGNLDCARQIGGPQMDAAYAVALGTDGTWEVGGYYSDPAVVSVGQPDAVDLSAEGGTDIFRATYAF